MAPAGQRDGVHVRTVRLTQSNRKFQTRTILSDNRSFENKKQPRLTTLSNKKKLLYKYPSTNSS